MWVAEGLTHRYPTKVLAELLPTCPQYCGHCTRMDLVGNSTAVIDKLKFVGKPTTGSATCSTTCAATPACATSWSPAATWRTCRGRRLEAFLTELLEIENIRDIRLATKA
jgi:lysine 2,3-aminomutase